MMDLVLVDSEEHDRDLAANVELVARAFFLPALEREVAHRAKRLLVDSLDLVEFALKRIDFAQDGKESSRYALFVVAPVPFQGGATHAFLRHPEVADNLAERKHALGRAPSKPVARDFGEHAQ